MKALDSEPLNRISCSYLRIKDTALPLTFGSVMEGGQKPVYDADLKADSDAAKAVDVFRLINRIDDQPMLPLEEAIGRYRAALAASSGPKLRYWRSFQHVCRRGTQEAVRRATAYAKAGAEAIWLTSPPVRG